MRKQAQYALIAVLLALLASAGITAASAALGVATGINWTFFAFLWALVFAAQQWPDVLHHDDVDAEPK